MTYEESYQALKSACEGITERMREIDEIHQRNHNQTLDLIQDLQEANRKMDRAVEIMESGAMKPEAVEESGTEARRIMAGFDSTISALKNSPTTSTKPLQIEAGKWYERRDGEIVGPVIPRLSDSGQYPFDICGRSYANDGKFFYKDDDLDAFDLIREVPAPTVDA